MSEQMKAKEYFVLFGRRSEDDSLEFIDWNPFLEESRRRASKLVDEGGWREIVIMPSLAELEVWRRKVVTTYGDPTLTIQPIEEVF